MELREALGQIAEIRQQMARGQIFRGYRSATAAFSGAAAVIMGVIQALCFPETEKHQGAFVLLWAGAAVICLALVGVEMVVRTRRSASQMQRQLTLLAVEQFMPSVAAGALLTYVMCEYVRAAVWMLPGLWMMLFALGVFASARLLPRAVFAVAGYYLVAGVLALVISARGGAAVAFAPWLMGGVFGAGQFAIAAILYYALERVTGNVGADERGSKEGDGHE